ncbi:MAG TPA: BT_3928 family protein [Chitinophagaceae bacterium]|nr:BT_3928 family protein [Chitinophagaceae bacterium]
MKIIVNIARVLVGVLFIFSGLVKANDPLGLSYKMQEFFDVWAQNESLTHFMQWLDKYALPFSIIMITLEIIVGVGILLGTWKKFFSKLLVLLIVFFAFLTGYAVLSGKIATCGCFGDCIPLPAMGSFIKDLVLLALVLIIYAGVKYIRPVVMPGVSFIVIVSSTAAVLGLQWYVLQHGPFRDCLPFKKGANLIEERKVPADAVPDQKEFRFYYKKDGKEQEFTEKNLPDSTWEFVRREDVIVKKGKDNEPPVKDFFLTTASGNDTTDAVLNTHGNYYLFFVKGLPDGSDKWMKDFVTIYTYARHVSVPMFVITSEPEAAEKFFNDKNGLNLPVLTLDGTSLKTAARTNPELYLMSGPVVENKWAWADFDKVYH